MYVENGAQRRDIFWVQDHATLRIACMRIEAREPEHCGFISRQFAIGDLDDVDFGAFPAGCGVAANETSKINITNPGIYGSAALFASASDLSQVTIGGLVKMGDFIKFDLALLSITTHSLIIFQPSKVEGGEHFSGSSYYCFEASLSKTVVLPGGDVQESATDDCTVTGNMFGSSLNDLRSEIKAILSDIHAFSSLLNGVHSEINIIRAQIDDVQHAANVQRRLDRGVSVGVVLVLLLVASWGFHRLATLKADAVSDARGSPEQAGHHERKKTPLGKQHG